MTMFFAAMMLASTQMTPAAPVDHSRHTPAEHAQHQKGQMHGGHEGEHKGQHKCCKKIDGKMQCQMMKGHGAHDEGHGAKQGHQGH